MLVILAGDQFLSPKQVCQSCLLADQTGQPRWQNGRLVCGKTIQRSSAIHPSQFECPMGFRVVNVD
jgi:hypothetical protein